MPLARLTCPDCHAVIKPAKPVEEGKKIKCPKCGNVFVAGAANGAPAQPVEKKTAAVAEPAKKEEPAPAKKKPMDDDEDDGPATYGFSPGEEIAKPEPEVVKNKSKPKPKPKRRRDEEDDEDDEDDEEEEVKEEKKDDVLDTYLKKHTETDPRGRATEIVTAPSNKIILTYGFLTLAQLVAFVYWIFPFFFLDHLVSPKEIKDDEGALFYHDPKDVTKPMEPEKKWEEIQKEAREAKSSDNRAAQALEKLNALESKTTWFRRLMMVPPFLLFFYCGAIVVGGVKMQSLESYGWAWTSVIMSLIPIGSVGACWAAVAWVMNLIGPFDFLYEDVPNLPYYVIIGGTSIWTLVVALDGMKALNSRTVKAAFAYVEE
jgi:hypothetical protein